MIADLFRALFQLPAQVASVLFLVDTIIRIVALLTVPRGRWPSAGLAWLMAIFFLPIVGGLTYIVIGRSQLPQHRVEDQTRSMERLVGSTSHLTGATDHDPEPIWLAPLAEMMLPVQPLRGRYQRPDLRNHRKIVVIDHETALVGSLNLIEPGYQKHANRRRSLCWQDVVVRVEGPPVSAVEAVFAADWRSETGVSLPLAEHPNALIGSAAVQVVPSGPGLNRRAALRLVTALVNNAERRLAITTPYFVPDESLLHAVSSASLRGVTVELFTGEIADQVVVSRAQKSYYAALLEAGVRIWLYPAPTVLHVKHITVDDRVVMLGSANMDIRSFELDLEVSIVVSGRGPTAAVRESEDDRRKVSHLLSNEEWSSRPRWQRMLDDLARLTSALQ